MTYYFDTEIICSIPYVRMGFSSENLFYGPNMFMCYNFGECAIVSFWFNFAARNLISTLEGTPF